MSAGAVDSPLMMSRTSCSAEVCRPSLTCRGCPTWIGPPEHWPLSWSRSSELCGLCCGSAQAILSEGVGENANSIGFGLVFGASPSTQQVGTARGSQHGALRLEAPSIGRRAVDGAVTLYPGRPNASPP